MDLIKKLEESHQEDFIEFNNNIINLQIKDLEKINLKLKNEENNLNNFLKNIEEKTNELKKKNLELEEIKNKFELPNETSFQTGDYFQRINSCDFYESYLNGQLKGQKDINNIFKDLIQQQILINSKLEEKVNQIEKELPFILENNNLSDKISVKSNKSSKSRSDLQISNELNQFKLQLNNKNEEINLNIVECEKIKENIKNLTEKVSNITLTTQNELIFKYNEIIKEIEKKKIELKQLENDYKKEETLKNNPKINKIKNENFIDLKSEINSLENWEIERNGLIQTIQKIKLEIQKIKRKSLIIDNPIKKSNKELNYEILRQSMQLEIDLINSNEHPIIKSIEIEKNYTETLNKEIELINSITKEIEQLEIETFNINKNDSNQIRLNLLKLELNELREKISK